MDVFAGTGTLIRFILRRDRVRILIWMIGFLITMAGTAAIFPDSYPTEADRQSRAVLIENPALRLITGPSHGTEDYTFGAMMATEMLGLSTVVVALMSIFMIVRHTRAEEESGRAELVRAAVVGPNAGMTAALIVTVAVNLLIGLTTALALSATLAEFDLHGSLLFGASMAAAGSIFAVITAITVQINEFSRGARGMAIAVMGVSYIVRGFGDMLDNALTWFPPFGTTLQTAPYVDNNWWPLVITVVLAVVLLPVAFVLSTRRDVAAALRPPRPGPAGATGILTRPLGLVVRLQRGTMLAWAVGIILFTAAYATIIGDVGEQFADNPLVESYFDVLGFDVGQVTYSVISMVVMFMGLLVSVVAVSAVTRLRTEETSLRAENVLATSVSRVRWASESVVFGLVVTTAILLAAGLAAGMVYAADTGDSADIWKMLGAMAVYAPAIWIAAGVALAVFGLYPKAMALAWFIPVYGAFALLIGPLLGLPEWLYNLSPFEYVPRVPAAEFGLVPLVVMTVIAAALVVAGLYGIRRRDMDFV